MSRVKQIVAAGAFVGIDLWFLGCRHSATPSPAVVAVFAGGTVSAAEIVDGSVSTGDMDQRIRDVAWRKILVGNWRADVEASRDYHLRVAELDHRESADLLLNDVFSQVEISEVAVDAYLVDVKKKHETPTVRIRHIFFRADAEESDEARSEMLAIARDARARTLAGEDFGDLVLEFSDSADASQGGVVDMLRPGMADPALDGAVRSLSEGEISDVIETSSGYHLIRLEHCYPPLAFDERMYRATAPEVLRKQEEDRLLSELLESLRASESHEQRWSLSEGVVPRPTDGVVLEIGEFTFTADDLAEARSRSEPALQRWDQRAAYLVDLLDRELLHRESLRRHPATDEEIRDRRARAAQTALAEGVAGREIELVKDAIPEATLGAFVAHPSSPLDLPETHRTRVVFCADGGSPYGALTAAEEVIDRVGTGSSLASLAPRYSDGPNADRGGDLGYLENVELFGYAPELARMAASLEIGEVSNPIRITSARLVSTVHALRAGFLIVELVDRRPPRRMNLEHDKEEIREQLWNRRETEFLAEHRDTTLAELGYRRVQ